MSTTLHTREPGPDGAYAAAAAAPDRDAASAGLFEHRHYLVLDAMRGLAAFAVLVGHRRDWFGTALLPHYYLAVDFFFILSGFVIDHAYRRRLQHGTGRRDYLVKRVIRLYPLVIVSGLLSAICEIGRLHLARQWPDAHFAWQALAGIVAVPTSFGETLFAYNPPLWSLFFELVANAAFMVLAFRGSTRALAVVTILSGIVLAGQAWTGPLSEIGVHPDTFWGGFVRVGFSFGTGCLLNRARGAGYLRRWRGRSAGLVLLLAALLAPITRYDAAYTLACVLGLFPALVALGANDEARWPRAAAFAGNVSYPVYVLHVPLLFAVSAALQATHLGAAHPGPIEGAIRIALVTGLAALSFYLFDRPVRSALLARWRRSAARR